MKKNYTLNRFYSEAKSLIENHNCTDPDCSIRVQFEIIEDKEKNGSPRLDCRICYENDLEFRFFVTRRTPEAALRRFNEILLESKDQWQAPQSVSVDLTDDLTQKDNTY